jgi:hypothetical protein
MLMEILKGLVQERDQTGGEEIRELFLWRHIGNGGEGKYRYSGPLKARVLATPRSEIASG